jgi:UDP-N-acetylglucosamine/UDP-N-acetylgalactosamine diphosphorylase
MPAPNLPAAVERLRRAGQEHVVEHARRLPAARAEPFLLAAAAHPWEALVAAALAPPRAPSPALRPPVALTLKRQRSEGGLERRLAAAGEALIAAGRVATLLLAGGQGTRLGHDGPKGTFPFGPEPDRTLYRILGERVAAASRRAGMPVPLLVMTASDTEAATRDAFGRAGTWGLVPGQVRFLRQGELPVLDLEGRALLAAPGALALAPDGHGGAVEALVASGALADLVAAGVEVLTTFHVDNPLARPLDPVTIGWMTERRARAVGKAVRKATPREKVGVFARDLEGRTQVVEYSELPEEGAFEELSLGSIGLHAFSLAWLSKLVAEPGFALPLHRALKRVPALLPDGRTETPAAPNAWKLERFLFDLFPLAGRVEVHEVERAREFAPVKNAEGDDSPATARALVDAEVRRRLRAGGRPEPATPSLRPLEQEAGPESP